MFLFGLYTRKSNSKHIESSPPDEILASLALWRTSDEKSLQARTKIREAALTSLTEVLRTTSLSTTAVSHMQTSSSRLPDPTKEHHSAITEK